MQEEDIKRRNKELLWFLGAVLIVVYLFWDFSEPLKDQLSCRSHLIIASSFPICNICPLWDSCALSCSFSGLAVSHLISLSLASWILSWNAMQWGKCYQFWERRSWETETGSLWAAEKFCGLTTGLWSTDAQGWAGVRSCDLEQGVSYSKHRDNPAAAESRQAHGYIWLF